MYFKILTGVDCEALIRLCPGALGVGPALPGSDGPRVGEVDALLRLHAAAHTSSKYDLYKTVAHSFDLKRWSQQGRVTGSSLKGLPKG